MFRSRFVACVSLGALALLACAACSRPKTDLTDRPGPTSETEITSAEVPSVPTFLEPQPQLTRRVEAAIAADPYLSISARNVDVTVEDGVATLRGSISDQAFVGDLERTVEGVPGVRDVNNEVEVSLVRDANDVESDERIAFALQRSLSSSPELGRDAEKVSVEVIHGHVRLRGTASEPWTERTVLGIVETTPGVRSIDNQIEVK